MLLVAKAAEDLTTLRYLTADYFIGTSIAPASLLRTTLSRPTEADILIT